jgi:N-(2-amino-2-carboxyethyl)-L-glutamate synthase
MPIITAPHDFNEDELYVDLEPTFGHSLFLKCEGFNFAGSIKLKAATEMVEAAERDGTLTPGSILVESSSGNLGVALSMIAASKGYGFLCVTDSRCNRSTRRTMEALGAKVHVVSVVAADAPGGLLGARIEYVRKVCASDDRYVWLNQYRNQGNWQAHYRRTAPAIVRQFPQLDVLFVGAGTTGTLMGCARFLREWHRPVRIVAVDTVGSVTFGGPPARRMIPGLGTSVRPPLLDESYVDEVLRVEERDTIRACHRLARRGFLFGGSTGTVVSGAMSWLAEHDARELTAVAIAPDLGERYLETVYQPDWVQEFYAEDMLDSDEPAAASGQPDPRERTVPRPARPARPPRRFRRVGTGASVPAADRESRRYGGTTVTEPLPAAGRRSPAPRSSVKAGG